MYISKALLEEAALSLKTDGAYENMISVYESKYRGGKVMCIYEIDLEKTKHSRSQDQNRTCGYSDLPYTWYKITAIYNNSVICQFYGRLHYWSSNERYHMAHIWEYYWTWIHSDELPKLPEQFYFYNSYFSRKKGESKESHEVIEGKEIKIENLIEKEIAG